MKTKQKPFLFLAIILAGIAIPYGYVLLFSKMRMPNHLDMLFLIYLPLFLAVVTAAFTYAFTTFKWRKPVALSVLAALLFFLAGYQIMLDYADTLFYHLHKQKLHKLVEQARHFDQVNRIYISNDETKEESINNVLMLHQYDVGDTSKNLSTLYYTKLLKQVDVSEDDYNRFKKSFSSLGFHQMIKYDKCIKFQRLATDYSWGVMYVESPDINCLENGEELKYLNDHWNIIWQ